MTLPSPGAEFGPYTLGDRIGRGAMGIVFSARHRGLDRNVALKLLSPELADADEYRGRFSREAKVLASLDSPNVVRVYDTGEIDGWWYIATELIAGGDLKSRLDSGAMGLDEALRTASQVGSGLAAAHALGILHRDIKPSNVLIRSTDPTTEAVLCDFGISAVANSDHTRTSGVIGTLGYMAPERHRGGPSTVASDVYALGCLLWACLSGRAPYVGTDFDVAIGHIEGEIPQLPGRGNEAAAINHVLQRAMAKNPQERFHTAIDFVREIDAIRPEEAETLLRTAEPPTIVPPPRTRPLPPPYQPTPPMYQPTPLPTATPPNPTTTGFAAPTDRRAGRSPAAWAFLGLAGGLLMIGIVVAILLLTRSKGSSQVAPPVPLTSPTMASSPSGFTQAACGASPSAYDQQVLNGGPIAYFPLGDTQYDSLCNAAPGSSGGAFLPGVTLSASGPGGSTGIYATAGAGSGPISPVSGSSGLTLAAWFKSSGVIQDQSLVALGDGNARGSRAGLAVWSSQDPTHSSKIQCPTVGTSVIGLDTVSSSNCFDTSSVGVDLWDGQWHFLALTVDPTGTVTAIVDGRELGSQQINAPSIALTGAGSVRLGTWRGNSVNQPLNGYLARVAVYAQALDPQSLVQTYSAGSQ